MIDMKLYVTTDSFFRLLTITTFRPDKPSGLVYEIDVRCGIVAAIKSGGASRNYVSIASSTVRVGFPFDANEILGITQ